MNTQMMGGLASTAVVGKITFEEAWSYGGNLMWVLVGFSVVALTVMLYLLFAQSSGAFLRAAMARISKAADPAAEGARIAERAYSAVDWLSDIAAIAPLVGLLGTVLGIFEAFSIVNSDLNQVTKSEVLTQGVSKAVVTTIFGLVVAIPSLVAHAFFRRRAARLIARLEERTDALRG